MEYARSRGHISFHPQEIIGETVANT